MTARQPRDTRLTCETCGYSTPTTTAAMAERCLRGHSCDLQRERDRRRAAVAARKAADGPRRDCGHPVAHHEHGTRNAYVLDRCRCRACRDANSARQRQVDKLKAYGQFDPFVDAEPVRRHVRELMAAGMGWQRAARLAKVSSGAMTKLLYGKTNDDGIRRPPTRRVRRETAERILAVRADLELLGAKAVVDATGARRRLRALVAHGWSMRQLALRLGMTESNFGRVIRSDDAMHAATVRKVCALYDELWDVPPRADDHRSRISVNRSKRYAAEHGWLPALAWDDDTIDDPGAWADLGGDVEDESPDVDQVAIDRFIAGDIDWQALTTTERLTAALQMDALGYSRNSIAALVHVNSRRLYATFAAGRPVTHTEAEEMSTASSTTQVDGVGAHPEPVDVHADSAREEAA